MRIASASKLLGNWEWSRAHAARSPLFSSLSSPPWPIMVDTAEDDRQDEEGVVWERVGRGGKGWEGMGRDVKEGGKLWPVHSYRTCVHTAPLRCSIGYSITLPEEQCGVQFHTKSISSTVASHTRVEQTLIRQSTAKLGAHKTPRPSLISPLTHMPPFHSSPTPTENQLDEPNQHTPVPSQSHPPDPRRFRLRTH